jgi:membrane glycosyltransferase
MSRFHLLQGAVGYLASVWWLVLLVLWVVLAQGSGGGAALAGPVAGPFALTLVVGGLLMAPKALGLAAHLRRNPPPRGRRGAFAATLLAELAVSALLAPAMMLHQVLAVVSTLCGIDRGWSPHLAGRPTFARLARFHAIEIGVGTVLCWLGAGGVLTPWVLPVGVCLVLTLPLSWLVAQDVSGWRLFAAPAPR